SYLNVGRPAASFCVEVGLRTRGGRFLPLARSNVMTTPRSSPSSDTSARWVDVRQDAPRDAVAAAWAGTRLPGAENGADASSPGDRPRSSDVHAPRPGCDRPPTEPMPVGGGAFVLHAHLPFVR